MGSRSERAISARTDCFPDSVQLELLCLYLNLSLCLYLYLSILRSIHSSIYFISDLVCIFVYVYVYIYLCLHPSIHPSIHPSLTSKPSCCLSLLSLDMNLMARISFSIRTNLPPNGAAIRENRCALLKSSPPLPLPPSPRHSTASQGARTPSPHPSLYY